MNTVIGLYGMMCSGKDTVADMLIKQDYRKISLSEDVLKPILENMGVKINRMNYIKLGKALKDFKKETLAFLSHALMNKGTDNKYVIPNIMTFEEARYYKEQKDIRFILIELRAEQKTRYERGIKRASDKDTNDLKEFKDLDMKNLTSTGLKELMHAGLNNAEIENNGSVEELEAKVKTIMQRLNL